MTSPFTASSFLSVKVTYRIPSSSSTSNPIEEEKGTDLLPVQHLVHSKLFADTQPARMGLPPGIEPCKPEPGEYGYSGMHDAGPLVPPREVTQDCSSSRNNTTTSSMACLIANVQAAKEYNDQYMTTIIRQSTTTTTTAAAATEETTTTTTTTTASSPDRMAVPATKKNQNPHSQRKKKKLTTTRTTTMK